MSRLKFLFATLLVLACGAIAAPAAAQGGVWSLCVARSSSSGTVYLGEPAEGADSAKAKAYRAAFTEAAVAGGVVASEVAPQNAFCFFAPRREDLSRMTQQLSRPCPSCSTPYRQTPVAWDYRDILPSEIAATASHVSVLAMPAPVQPVLIPVSTAGEPPPPAEPAPPVPVVSVRWQAFLCGTDARIGYAVSLPADGPAQTEPLKVLIAGGPLESPREEVLAKAAEGAPSCASANFVKVASLADLGKGAPARGAARVDAMRKRLDDLTVQIQPFPAPVVVEAAPPVAPATAKGQVRKAVATPPAPAASPPIAVAVARPPPRQAPAAVPLAPAAAPVAVASAAPKAAAEVASAMLNAEISKRNAEVDARNAAAAADYEKRMAAYKAAQDSFSTSQAAYERNRREHDAQVAEADRARTAWEAKVKACNAGDRAACAQ